MNKGFFDALKVLGDENSVDIEVLAEKIKTALMKAVKKAYPDCDVSIQGYTDNTGFKGSTVEESFQKNIKLSQDRADAVKSYILAQGAAPTQIKSSTGFGENNPVADNSTKEGKAQNRRVEVYMYASQAMIQAAEQQAN